MAVNFDALSEKRAYKLAAEEKTVQQRGVRQGRTGKFCSIRSDACSRGGLRKVDDGIKATLKSADAFHHLAFRQQCQSRMPPIRAERTTFPLKGVDCETANVW